MWPRGAETHPALREAVNTTATSISTHTHTHADTTEYSYKET